MYMCVYACVRMCVCVCVCACVHAGMLMHANIEVYECMYVSLDR